MNEKRITESELILPALYLMSITKDGCIVTSELIKELTDLLHPTGQDMMILDNRNDTYFSQKVRNLKSHNTLSRYGFANYSNGVYQITEEGKNYVMQNIISLQYLLSSDFEYVDIKDNLANIVRRKKSISIPYNELVTEGDLYKVTIQTRKRSQKLRDAAIEHFTKDGKIVCDCCGFEFKSYYGDKYGEPCIEIHHMKPIFQYEGISVSKTIDEALQNLLPVCPNCHRVIHKNHITCNKIPEFKKEISLIHDTHNF